MIESAPDTWLLLDVLIPAPPVLLGLEDSGLASLN